MKRPARIALNILLPPLLAAGCFIAVMGVSAVVELAAKPSRTADGVIVAALQFGLLIVLVAYVIAGLPSLLHAGLMELAYRKFPANRWAAVGISAISGSVAGLLMSLFFIADKGAPSLGIFILVPLGAFVGFLLGAFIKWLSQPKSATPLPTLRGCE